MKRILGLIFAVSVASTPTLEEMMELPIHERKCKGIEKLNGEYKRAVARVNPVWWMKEKEYHGMVDWY